MWWSTSITATVLPRRLDQLAEVRQLARVEPSGGLVEQQQLGLGHERARQRHPLLHGVRQRPGQAVGDARRSRPCSAPPAPGRAAAARRDLTTAVRASGSARASCETAGRRPSRSRARSGPGNSPTPWSVRAIPSEARRSGSHARHRLAAPAERAGVRPHEPADDVEQRGLAGAVRADDPEHLARGHVDRDTVERRDPAERDNDVADRQAGAGGRRGGSTPTRAQATSARGAVPIVRHIRL